MGLFLIMMFLLGTGAITFIVIFILSFKDRDVSYKSTTSAAFAIILVLSMFILVDEKSVETSDAMQVELSDVSIMHDDEIVILRHGDNYRAEFTEHKEYLMIINRDFELWYTINYNIKGEEIYKDYELKFTK